MIFTLTPLVISDAQADPDTAHALDFVETTLEGAAPFGYDRNFLDPGHRASRKTPAFVDARLAALEQISLDAGCPSVLDSAWAGRYGAGSAGSFQAVDADGTVVEGTYLNDNSGLSIDGTVGATAFGDVESDWGAGSSGGMVRKFLYGLGPDEFVAGFAVANTTRNGYVFGVQGSCSEAWEVYADWFGAPIEAPVPPSEWAVQFGTSETDVALGLSAVDGGGVLVAGYVQGALEGQFHRGSADAFVRLVDAQGATVWTRQFGSSQADIAIQAEPTENGGFVVAGETAGHMDGWVNAGPRDGFVRKVSADGSLLWSHQIRTSTNDGTHGLAVDGNGDVIVAGWTHGSLASHFGNRDAFVRKLSSEGEVLWTHQAGSSSFDAANDVAVDDDGNVFVTGFTSGGLTSPSSGADVFVRKLNPDGQPLWTYETGSPGQESAMGIHTTTSGGVIVVGQTSGSLAAPNQGDNDVVVFELDAGGNLTWMHQLGTSEDDLAFDVEVRPDGSILVTGSSAGDFGDQPNQGENDAFVAVLEPTGTLVDVRLLGTVSHDRAFSVASTGNGGIVLAGETEGSLPGPNQGERDVFVTQILLP